MWNGRIKEKGGLKEAGAHLWQLRLDLTRQRDGIDHWFFQKAGLLRTGKRRKGTNEKKKKKDNKGERVDHDAAQVIEIGGAPRWGEILSEMKR